MLLIQRADNGYWAMPAGAMELGESIADCAARELFEETGLLARGVTPFALYTGPAVDPHQHVRRTRTSSSSSRFRVDDWAGELLTVTEETTDAGFFDPRRAARTAGAVRAGDP